MLGLSQAGSGGLRTGPDQQAEDSSPRFWLLIGLTVSCLLAAVVRVRLLSVPFERDEGEFAYVGQLILQGIPPYSLAYNMKFPGIYYAYALVMAVFGQTTEGVHRGLLVFNIAAIVLVLLLARRVCDSLAGAVAAGSYALLSMEPSVLGTAAHATHFIVPFALGGLLLLLRAIDSGNATALFWSGFLLGVAVTMKQHAATFILFAIGYLLWMEGRRRPFAWRRYMTKLGVFLLGALVPLGGICLVLYRAGVFDRFWFWTISYASEYVSMVPVRLGLNVFMTQMMHVVGPSAPLWGIAGVGLTAVFWDKRLQSKRIFVFGFLLFSFLAICPGFYFREHYFVLLLPAIALLAGLAISSIRHRLVDTSSFPLLRSIPVGLFILVFLYAVIVQQEFFFQASPREASRIAYGINPFPESLEVAEYIRDHSTRGERIAVFGSEPQIYFYAERVSATGYIYTYALTENHPFSSQMQREMITEIEAARPQFIVAINIKSSWGRYPDSDSAILPWFKAYTNDHYELDGVADILSLNRTEYRWGRDALRYVPQSPYFLLVYKRKQERTTHAQVMAGVTF
jgi:hypothetical protein